MEIANLEKEVRILKRQLETLYVATMTLEFTNMPVEQEIKDKCIGRMNFVAQRIINERVAEKEFAKLENERSAMYIKMKTIAEDYPHLKTHLVEEQDLPSIYK